MPVLCLTSRQTTETESLALARLHKRRRRADQSNVQQRRDTILNRCRVLKLVEYHDVLVSVDARLPNPLFAEAVRNNRLPGFSFPTIQPEVTQLDSRLDFKLSGPDGICWVETKSATLVEQDLALFPDAPTHRGRRHLETLMELLKTGVRAAVIFIIQRPDAIAFAPNEAADPVFSETLQKAANQGVEVRAFRCSVSLHEITITGEIPVYLDN